MCFRTGVESVGDSVGSEDDHDHPLRRDASIEVEGFSTVSWRIEVRDGVVRLTREMNHKKD